MGETLGSNGMKKHGDRHRREGIVDWVWAPEAQKHPEETETPTSLKINDKSPDIGRNTNFFT